jgi:hypothetical protein
MTLESRRGGDCATGQAAHRDRHGEKYFYYDLLNICVATRRMLACLDGHSRRRKRISATHQ